MRKKAFQEFQKKIGKRRVRLSEPMSHQTTLKIGGPSDLFYEAKTKEELIEAIKAAQEFKIPYFVFSGGSNILVSDKGIRGLVVKIVNSKWKIVNSKVAVEAGMNLSKLLKGLVKRGLSGLEFCAGIPGAVGGAIVGNAGTKTKWIGERVLEVEVLDEKGKVRKIPRKNCQFDYRESRFKKKQEIILSVKLQLSLDSPQNIKKRMTEFLEKRKNQPKEPSAGSVFKNPPKQSAGDLIEKVGLRGYQIGGAKISPGHTNFIVNLGWAKSQDVLKLISLVKKRVKEKFGIKLEEEIQIIGE